MKRLTVTLALIFTLSASPALAGFGSSSSSSSRSSSSSSSSRSSSSSSSSKSSGSSGKCCSSSSKSSSQSKSGGSSKTSKPTASAPSSGSKPAKPVAKTIPKLAPPAPRIVGGRSVSRVSVPQGRNFYRDRTFLVSHPAYADPYGHSYYGSYSYGNSNPYFYMWLYAMMDDDRSNNPDPPESDGQISNALVSYLQIIKQEQAITTAKD